MKAKLRMLMIPLCRGRKHSEETKRKIGEANKGQNNGSWKGDNVGYNALHEWIKNCLPKPLLCQSCKKFPSHDLANISQKYFRNLSDWEWLCRSCHMQKDGRISKLINYKKGDKRLITKKIWSQKGFLFCRNCKRKDKKHQAKGLCKGCYNKIARGLLNR